ncbi:hypothetical protein [Methylopila sp. 73B]|uniref:hypothetical protein n=1 Tax=Methylopila sp. 73B TaxID=1120792 RepID=UPI000377515B|nr:hypothetical protein [Methylopila sp. 73B]
MSLPVTTPVDGARDAHVDAQVVELDSMIARRNQAACLRADADRYAARREHDAGQRHEAAARLALGMMGLDFDALCGEELVRIAQSRRIQEATR